MTVLKFHALAVLLALLAIVVLTSAQSTQQTSTDVSATWQKFAQGRRSLQDVALYTAKGDAKLKKAISMKKLFKWFGYGRRLMAATEGAAVEQSKWMQFAEHRRGLQEGAGFAFGRAKAPGKQKKKAIKKRIKSKLYGRFG